MATRQYIGARYVPLFDGNWSDAKAYEPLTIVQYMGSSYTSKQAVPAGTLPTNTTYWALTGNYNAQIEEYRQEVEDYKEITDGKIEQLFKTVEIALIGDSSYATIVDTDYLGDKFENAHITNYATNGAKWENIYSQLSSIVTAPDIILINCGSNDLPNTLNSDVGGALGAPDVTDHTVSNNPTTAFEWMKYCLAYIKNTYPRAQIFNTMRAIPPHKVSPMWYYYAYFQEMIMREWSVPVIDKQMLCNFSTFINAQNSIFTISDGIHYNAEMQERVFGKIGNAIQVSNPATFGAIYPQVFYAPASVYDNNYNVASRYNIMNMLIWIARHCLTPGWGSSAGNIQGKGAAWTSDGVIRSFFRAWVTSDELTHVEYYTAGGQLEQFTINSNNEVVNVGPIITTGVIKSDNTKAWYELPAGDYNVRASAMGTLSLPTEIYNLIHYAQDNTMMSVRYGYGDTYSNYCAYVMFNNASNGSLVKGSRRIANGNEHWYKVSMDTVTIA